MNFVVLKDFIFDYILGMFFLHDGRLCVNSNGTFRALDISSVHVTQLHKNIWKKTIVSRDSPRCAFVTSETVSICKSMDDVDSGVEIQCKCAEMISSNMKYAAVFDEYDGVSIFDLETQNTVCRIKSNVMLGVEVIRQSVFRLREGNSGIIAWDIATGACRRFPVNRLIFTSLDFSWDGTLLAIGDAANRVTIVESATGRVVHVIDVDVPKFPRKLSLSETTTLSWSEGSLKIEPREPGVSIAKNPHAFIDDELDYGNPYEIVTACIEFVPAKGRSVIVAGHRDGSVTLHDLKTLEVIQSYDVDSVKTTRRQSMSRIAWNKLYDALVRECGEEAVLRSMKACFQ